MTNTLSNPLGKGIYNHNSITFSSGVGVTNQVSTQLNWAQVLEFAKNPQCVEKQNARWILPHSIASRKKMDAEGGNFGLIWVDVDNPPSGGIDSVIKTLIKSAPYLAYTTKGATESVQKCRVLIPLLNSITYKNWLRHQKHLNTVLEGAGIGADPCNLKPNQILFLPNRGECYLYRHREGFYNAKSLHGENLTPYTTPTMASVSPIQLRAATSHKEARGGVIARFNFAYSAVDILIRAGYSRCPSNSLLWRHPDSESGSYSASIDPSTGRVHSLSSRDPLWTGGGGQGAHDSFSVFCVLFCDGDMRKAVWRAANEWLAKEGAHG